MQLTLHALKITDEQFEQVVRANPEWKFEQTAAGEIIIVPPTGGTSGEKNLNLSMQFGIWVEDNLELGRGFDSSTLFILPNSAKRMPNVSWVRRDRWDALTQKQRDGYVPLCPDFIIELRSPFRFGEEKFVSLKNACTNTNSGTNDLMKADKFSSLTFTDSLEDLQAKMRDYMENGAHLGWLIAPQNSQVEVYRLRQEVEVLRSPTQLSGEDVLPGFVLRLERIWN